MNIVDRAKNILITPKSEWAVVDTEQANNVTILTGYVLPMLFIGAFAAFIGIGLIGVAGMKGQLSAGLISALVFILRMIILVFAIAATIDVLAPSFGSQKNWAKSFQLAAYSLTAAYVGSLFLIFPALWILVLICTLYSLYPLYVGLAVLKKTTVDKQVAYFAVILIVTVLLAILLGLLEKEIIKAFQPKAAVPDLRNLLR
jgi:hypothetical protein